jgi:hypothetical protein
LVRLDLVKHLGHDHTQNDKDPYVSKEAEEWFEGLKSELKTKVEQV